MKSAVMVVFASLVTSVCSTLTRTALKSSGTVSLVFTGDVSFGGAVRYYAEKGYYKYNEALAKVAPYLRQADIAIVNYESPFIQKKDETVKNRLKVISGVSLRSTLDSGLALRFAGYDIISVANNHLNDFNEISANTTVKTLRSLGLIPMGYSYGRFDAPQVPVIKVIRGVKIAFLAYCTRDALCQSRKEFSSGPAYYTKYATKRDVRALKQSESPDVIVVFLHWGEEYEVLPSANQRQTARELAALNVSMVIGSHSHRIVKHCFHGNTLIAYGLGNFLFPPYPGDGNHEIFNWALKPKCTQKKRTKWHIIEKNFEKNVQTIRNPTTESMILRLSVNKHGIVGAKYLPVNIRFRVKKRLLQPSPATNKWIRVCSKEDTHCMDKGLTCI
ncbi:predicted protein [Nematostella vectensis]|uniref:Capsule synthesis protein CapA domain-containing protein n=1 Tax=Nematostella vectensis TaxID=45351 RepID=A7SA27_NEMVE|nr:predicted protein [Nematostella vectensis]|eukprot:XP_001631449.1 predicted protein [Nematostella vectensis]